MLIIPSVFCNMLLWLLGAALLGILLGYLWQLAKIENWRNLFESKESDYNKLLKESKKITKSPKASSKKVSVKDPMTDKLKSQISSLKMTTTKVENSLNIATKEKETAKAQVESWRKRYEDLEKSLASKDAAMDELRSEMDSYQEEMARTKESIAGIRTEKEDFIRVHSSYKDRFEEANLERNTLKAKYDSLIQTRKDQEANVSQSVTDNSNLLAEIEALKAQVASANSSSSGVQSEFDALKAATETANAEKEELKVKYESLLRHQEQMEAQSKDTSAVDEIKSKWESANSENATLKAEIERLKNIPAPQPTDEFKNKWQAASTENASLLAQIATLKNTPAPQPTDEFKSKWESASTENSALKAELERLKNQPAPQATDEFKSKWETLNTERTGWISKNNSLNTENERLRMEMERLKAQAATPPLPPRPVVSTPIAAVSTKEDDLKKIEGIGPKIEGLIKADGIKTWEALSNTEVERLQRILTDAGPRYKMHNPGTWSKQAGMCHRGEWDALKKWQDELDGGR